MTLKVKSDMWLVSYTLPKSCKQYSYMTYGSKLIDVYEAHIQNPKYERSNVVSIVQIQDYKEY